MLKLVVLACLLTVTCADERSCCFAPTFTMNGRLTFILNTTHENADKNSDISMNATLTAMVDFPSNKYAVIYAAKGNKNQLHEKSSIEASLTVILDANSTRPRFYNYVKINATTRIEGKTKQSDDEHCSVGRVENAELIRGYQCLPKQLLRGGDVKDGIIEMLPPQFLPTVIKDKMKILFDQATCSPRSISFSPTIELDSSKFRINLEFEADNKPGYAEMPEIPDDVDVGVSTHECHMILNATSIPPAQAVDQMIQMALMKAGLQ